jgi:hypothetical protein
MRVISARTVSPRVRRGSTKWGSSGSGALQVIHHEVTAVCLHFLQKPFAPAALARKVRELLDAT